MNRWKIKEIAVFGSIIFSAALLLFFISFIRPCFNQNHKTLFIRCSSVEKIARGTTVTYAGSPVGEITGLEKMNTPIYEKDGGPPYIYELTAEIDPNITLCTADSIIPSTAGLLGEKVINIVPNANTSIENEIINDNIIYAEHGDAMSSILDSTKNLIMQTDGVMNRLSSLIQTNETDLKQTVTAIKEFIHQINNLLEKAHTNKFLEQSEEAVTNIASVTNLVQKSLLKLEDAGILNNLAASICEVKEIINNANKEGKVTSIVESLVKVLSTVEIISNEVQTIVIQSNKIIEDINSEKGSLGKLVHDDRLYNDLDALVNEVRALVYDINVHGLFFTKEREWQRSRRPLLNPPTNKITTPQIPSSLQAPYM